VKLIARGWNRNMGDNVIANVDLTQAQTSRDPSRNIHFDKEPVIFSAVGEVSIDWGKSVTLGGKYRWELELSTEEIVRLFKNKLGSELDVDLLENHGFTVSDTLKKKMIGNIKIADLTLGELANLAAPAEPASTPAAAEPVARFPRRI